MDVIVSDAVQFIDEDGVLHAALVVSVEAKSGNVNLVAFPPDHGGTRFTTNVPQEASEGQKFCWRTPRR